MIDPLTAVSLASAIVQFIDFSSKIVSKGYDVYQTADGVLPYNRRLQESIDRVDGLCVDLSSPVTSNSAISQNEQAIRAVSKQCIDVAGELRAALVKLQANPKSVSSSLRKALKSVWSDKELRSLEKRLASLYTELQLCLSATLRDGQSEVMSALAAMTKYQAQLRSQNQADLMALRQDLLDAITAAPAAQYTSKATNIPANLDDLASKMKTLTEESAKVQQKHQLLQSLVFDTMQDRHRNVQTKHGGTFDWIFDASHASKPLEFSTWLQKRGGIFWISGKAGSGKSTLMKSICSDNRTATKLKDWAGSGSLTTASYFFWNAGTDLDKSQEGLLRKILFDILSRNPDMVPGLVKTLSERYLDIMQVDPRVCPWALDDLLSAFLHLVSTPPVPMRFCFFLDGLDEYSGEPRELVRTLKKISMLPNVKFCVSSRNWPAFEAEFGENSGAPSLALHDHTKDDIRLYINEVLEQDPIFAQLRKEDDRYEGLVAHLVSKSQGVFLWIFLVVRDLSNSLPNKDSFEDLQKRVDQFPEDLDPFFMRMLDSIKPFYWKSSAEMLLVQLFDDIPVELMALRYFTEDQAIADAAEIRLHSNEEWTQMVHTMRTRLKARCLDFTQVFESRGCLYVHFIHRTVFDFLRQDHIYRKLKGRVGSDFLPGIALCEGYHSYLKSLPEDPRAPFEKEEASNIMEAIIQVVWVMLEPKHAPYDNAELYALLDNVERSLSQLTSLVGSKYSFKNPFSPFDDWEQIPSAAMLMCAVQFELVEYTALRFKRDPSLARYLVRDEPTLYTILTANLKAEMVQLVVSVCPDAHRWPVPGGSVPDGQTVWGDHVYQLGRHHPMETEDRDKRRIGAIAICLAEAGADLDVVTQTSYSKKPMTAMEILRGLLLPYDVEILEALYAKQVKARLESVEREKVKSGRMSKLLSWFS